MGWRIKRGIVVSCLLFCAGTSFAQSINTGTIAGEVKDATGAVLPGVTIEAASPALIEKVRAVTSDGGGLYKIVDLRPGRYTVTFTLPGFATVQREGIELTTGFTAVVNAELKVGAVTETIIVSGQSPVVDTQNTNQQKVLSRQILESVPTNNAVQGFASLVPGAVQSVGVQRTVDLGGSNGEPGTTFSVHGGRGQDLRAAMDGMGVATMMGTGGGTSRYYTFNQVAGEEITLQISAASAEGETGGVLINMVPRDGGNVFKGIFQGAFTNGDLQGTNLSQNLIDRGLLQSAAVRKIYEAKGGLGGPVMRDRLWFYTSHGKWLGSQLIPGNYFNKLAGQQISSTAVTFFEPDLDQPTIYAFPVREHGLRLTWQAAAKHKITGLYSNENGTCHCGIFSDAGNVRGEATMNIRYRPNWVTQTTWSFPATNKLLFEAGAEHVRNMQVQEATGPFAGIGKDRPIIDQLDGYLYGSRWARGASLGLTDYSYAPSDTSHSETRFSVSYITGSHAFKFGESSQHGVHNQNFAAAYPEVYTFRNRVPVSLTQIATPFHSEATMNVNLGLYAQDQWTIDDVTLNIGARFSYLHTSTPAQTSPSGKYNPGFSFPAVDTIINWKDFSPRLGAAWDVRGTGRTALKWSLGRYIIAESLGQTTAAAGPSTLINTATRTWNDSFYAAGDPRNGNYVPDCDLFSTAANAECGALSNANFGRLGAQQTTYSAGMLQGWHVRPFNWQTSVSLQHELRPGIGMNASYFRTWFGNFNATQNQALSAADFDPFCVTAPVDSRIPGGGGQQLCGFRDIKPSIFGTPARNVIVKASTLGEQTEVHHAIDLTLNARFGRGGLLSGGLSTLRTSLDACDIALNHPEATATMTSPSGTSVTTGPTNSTEFCRVTVPFEGMTQLKLNGIYPFPGGVQVSATFQHVPGAPILGSFAFTNAQIQPSLGRNLGQCRNAAVCNGTVSLANIIEPNIDFEGARNQLDMRVTKFLQMGRARFRGNIDLYNVLNRSSIISFTTVYSPTNSWLRPTGVLGARLLKVGGIIDF